MTPKEAHDMVAQHMAEALKGFVGGPVDKTRLEQQVRDSLSKMHEGGVLSMMKRMEDLLVDLAMATMVGMPEGFDPKPRIRALTDHELDYYIRNFIPPDSTGFPSNLIILEKHYRDGHLVGDWVFERKSFNDASLTFALKKAMDYIALDLTVEEETPHGQ